MIEILNNIKAIFCYRVITYNLNKPLKDRLFLSQSEWLKYTPRIWRQINRGDNKFFIK